MCPVRGASHWMVRGVDVMACEEQLKEMGLFRLKRGYLVLNVCKLDPTLEGRLQTPSGQLL